jgi:hypothetical protein
MINGTSLLKSGWGRSLSAGLTSFSRQLDDYQKVQCPKCGTIDMDERILSYGLLHPRTVVWIVLAIIAILLVVDILT